MPMTPKEFKDRLIFGPFSRSPRDSSSQYLDSLSETLPLFFFHRHRRCRRNILRHLSRRPSPPAAITTGAIVSRPRSPPLQNRTGHGHEKDHNSSRSVIRQAFALLVVYLSLGALTYWLNRDHYVVNQTHPILDGLYFCIVTMCTIRYGDITPNSVVTKLFSIMFVLVGFGFIDILLSGMVSYVLDLQESCMLDSAKRRDEPDRKTRS